MFCYLSLLDLFAYNQMKVHTKMDSNVTVLRMFPGIPIETVRSALKPPIKGVVLSTYGAGNVAGERSDILEAFKEATYKRDVIIVNCSQCLSGRVTQDYAAGRVRI